MPNEAIGFVGTLSGKVVKVIGFSSDNKCKLSAEDLTAVWKDKYANVRGVPDMPPLKLGDRVTVTAFQFEGRLRSTAISKQEGAAPSGEASAAPLAVPAGTVVQGAQIAVYFSPHGGCTDAIVKELDAAKESVLVQAYASTLAHQSPRCLCSRRHISLKSASALRMDCVKGCRLKA